MWSKTIITDAIGIQFPIIQAPMAGSTTPELVAAVSNAGGLGSLGAGYMSAEEIKAAIIQIRRLTTNPFAVNLFIPENHHATERQISQMCHWIEQACPELNTPIKPVLPPYLPSFEDQIKIIIEENVSVLSFTFGILDDNCIKQLKKSGIYLIGTATNPVEARTLREHHIDAVVAQGREAGGHRGTFIGKAEDALIGVHQLSKDILEQVNMPVIAAGGIMNAKGMVSALQLGVHAIQLGTAFLCCDESGIHPLYKQALLNSNPDDTALMRVFSGKMARGLKNKFYERMLPYKNAILDYPIQNALTRSMRQAAAAQGNIEFMSMWAGEASHLSRTSTATQLIERLINDVDELLTEKVV